MADVSHVELALGKIKIELIDSSTTNPIVYFGIINFLRVTDSEQLKVFYAPDDNSPTLRSRFGTLSLSGKPGQIILSGVLASLKDDSGTFCSGFNNLVESAIERKVWEKINLRLNFDFDDNTGDKIYNLYDGRVASPKMQGEGNMMSGQLTLQYSWSEPE